MGSQKIDNLSCENIVFVPLKVNGTNKFIWTLPDDDHGQIDLPEKNLHILSIYLNKRWSNEGIRKILTMRLQSYTKGCLWIVSGWIVDPIFWENHNGFLSYSDSWNRQREESLIRRQIENRKGSSFFWLYEIEELLTHPSEEVRKYALIYQ